MTKNALNWFDRMMMGITFAEAGEGEPDVSHITKEDAGNLFLSEREEICASYEGEAVPVR